MDTTFLLVSSWITVYSKLNWTQPTRKNAICNAFDAGGVEHSLYLKAPTCPIGGGEYHGFGLLFLMNEIPALYTLFSGNLNHET